MGLLERCRQVQEMEDVERHNRESYDIGDEMFVHDDIPVLDPPPMTIGSGKSKKSTKLCQIVKFTVFFLGLSCCQTDQSDCSGRIDMHRGPLRRRPRPDLITTA